MDKNIKVILNITIEPEFGTSMEVYENGAPKSNWLPSEAVALGLTLNDYARHLIATANGIVSRLDQLADENGNLRVVSTKNE